MRTVKYIYEIYISDGEPRPIETTTSLAGIAVGHYIQLQDENSGFDVSKTFRIEAIESLILHRGKLDTIEQKILVFCKPKARDFAP